MENPGENAELRHRRSGTFRFFAGAIAAGLVLAGAIVVNDDAAALTHESFVVSLGDRIRVDGAPIGCRITRLAGHGERPYVECRRQGNPTGSYGVYFSGRDVLVARFRSSKEARVVFKRSHSTSVERCG